MRLRIIDCRTERHIVIARVSSRELSVKFTCLSSNFHNILIIQIFILTAGKVRVVVNSSDKGKKGHPQLP